MSQFSNCDTQAKISISSTIFISYPVQAGSPSLPDFEEEDVISLTQFRPEVLLCLTLRKRMLSASAHPFSIDLLYSLSQTRAQREFAEARGYKREEQ